MAASRINKVTVLLFSSIAFQWSVAYSSTEECQHDKTTFRCVKFIKNYDADTVTFDLPNTHPIIGEKISVRVRGLDTPEIKGGDQCEKTAARTAQRLVEHLLKNAKRIDLVSCGRDKYFRLLCSINYDGNDLASILFKNQLAYAYDGGTKQKVNWCDHTKKRVPASY